MKTLKIVITFIALQLSTLLFSQKDWTSSNSGLPNSFAINDFEIVDKDIYSGGSFFNGTNFEARIYKSSNDGVSWTQLTTTGLNLLYTGNAFLYHNNKFFISGSVSNSTQNYSVFVSTNNGQSWSSSNSGLPNSFAINDFEIVGEDIYASGSFFNGTNFEARIYKSSNDGVSWTQLTTTGLNLLYTGNAFLYHNNKFFISGSVSNSAQNYSVFVSTNNGQSWSSSNSGLPNNFAINDFEIVGEDIYASGSFFNGTNFEARIYKSSNDGLSWSQITTTGLNILYTGNAFLYHNNKFFISGSVSNSTQNYSVFASSSTLSVNEYSKEMNYKLFPNPFQNEIFLQDLNSNIIKVELYDALGNRIKFFNENLNNDNLTLDLTDLKKGVYILILYSENKKFKSTKIIKR